VRLRTVAIGPMAMLRRIDDDPVLMCDCGPGSTCGADTPLPGSP